MEMKTLERFNEKLLKDYKRSIKAAWLASDKFILLLNPEENFQKKKFNLDVNKLKQELKLDIDVKTYETKDFFKSVTLNDLRALEEIKNAVGVYDPTAFLTPLKSLLDSGQVLGTPESVGKILDSARERFKNIESFKKQILFNCYRAVVDSSSAALVARGFSVPVAEAIPKLLKKNFVKERLLEGVYISLAETIINKYKAFEHGRLKFISGKELESLHNGACAFVERFKPFVEKIFVESSLTNPTLAFRKAENPQI